MGRYDICKFKFVRKYTTYSELLKLLYNISDTMSKFSFKITEGIESIEQDFDDLLSIICFCMSYNEINVNEN